MFIKDKEVYLKILADNAHWAVSAWELLLNSNHEYIPCNLWWRWVLEENVKMNSVAATWETCIYVCLQLVACFDGSCAKLYHKIWVKRTQCFVFFPRGTTLGSTLGSTQKSLQIHECFAGTKTWSLVSVNLGYTSKRPDCDVVNQSSQLKFDAGVTIKTVL